MNTKEQILELYYSKHLKQNDIAKIVGTSNQYISKIVKNDNRYEQEKSYRKELIQEKRATYIKEYQKNYQRPKKNDNSYEQLKEQLKQDSLELSILGGHISDYNFVKWNSNAYEIDKNGNLKLVKGLKVGADVPKIINMNIKIPTQKYKNKYCYSH